MQQIWSYYLSAFKNIFNYKDKATRSELNWFLAFMFVFWVILFFIIMLSFTSLIIIHNIEAIAMAIILIFLVAGLYFLIHIFPLLALVKRRINTLFPTKSVWFFTGWLGLWLFQTVLSIYLFCMTFRQMISATAPQPPYINPIQFILMAIIGQICALIYMGFLLYIMIKDKPLEKFCENQEDEES